MFLDLEFAPGGAPPRHQADPDREPRHSDRAAPASPADVAVLAAGLALRISRNGIARGPVFNSRERQSRVAELLRIWDQGCLFVMDERLFADTVAKYPELAARIKKHVLREDVRDVIRQAHTVLISSSVSGFSMQ